MFRLDISMRKIISRGGQVSQLSKRHRQNVAQTAKIAKRRYFRGMTITSDFKGPQEIHSGARYYGALTLPLYDAAVLRIAVPFGWGISLGEELAMYDRCAGQRHLDVGVASGYFLDRTIWPVDRPQITLMDLNPNATSYAARRLRRYDVREVVGDALEPFPVDGRFDSIGLFHLLHCMPGEIADKEQVFDHAIDRLAPGGVVFGASVTPLGLNPNPLARLILWGSNRKGALNNLRDSHEALKSALERRFRDARVKLTGLMTTWEARDPR